MVEEAKQIVQELRNLGRDESACACYHSKMTEAQKTEVFTRWYDEEDPLCILVATGV